MLLMLFSSDPHHARLAESAGIDAVVVDLEHKGKSDRQKGFDLEINDHTPEHVSRIRECSSITIVARINAVSEDSAGEIDEVLAAGADYVMLPMARSSRDAGRFLGLVAGRAKTIVQIETLSLLHEIYQSDAFAKLDWDFAYAGLNDLMVASGQTFWYPVVSGEIERLRQCLRSRSFGFGGLTVVDGGAPVPCALLAHEVVRLGCDISILRRSFLRDIRERDWTVEVRRIRDFIERSRNRRPEIVEQDREALLQSIQLAQRS